MIGRKRKVIKTGIPGLDELLGGGLEEKSITTVLGGPGSGKSTLVLQYIYNGAKLYKQAGMFISFEETKEDIYVHSLNYGWDFEKLEDENMFTLLTYKPYEIKKLFDKHDSNYRTAILEDGSVDFSEIKGLGWRKGEEIVINPPRPFIQDLDDLPIPLHNLLPLSKYRMPLIHGPFTFVVTSRGCPAGCTFCIKHLSYQYTVRLRSPELLMQELWQLKKLGINNVHMYADLFTVNRDQVVELCQRMIEENIEIKWTCNSRVDYVDKEMLEMMGKAGCRLISWGIESGSEQILKNVHKGIKPEDAKQALLWSKEAGIMNWGYFIIGLPGETEDTIRQTIAFAKELPLDIALFHIAAPYPGTPFFLEVVEKGWFRKGVRWEQIDMDRETVLNYPQLSTEKLIYWQKRAFREWALRPGPIITYLKMLLSDPATIATTLHVGLQHINWILFGEK